MALFGSHVSPERVIDLALYGRPGKENGHYYPWPQRSGTSHNDFITHMNKVAADDPAHAARIIAGLEGASSHYESAADAASKKLSETKVELNNARKGIEWRNFALLGTAAVASILGVYATSTVNKTNR